MKKYLLIAIFLFLFIPKNAFALDMDSYYPKNLYLHHIDSTLPVSELSISNINYNNRWFYGYNFTGSSQRGSMRFYYNFSDGRVKFQTVSMNFIIYHKLKSNYLNPITVYLQSGENLTACSVSTPQHLDFQKYYGISGGNSGDTVEQMNKEIGTYSTVSCNESYIYDNFAILIGQNYTSVTDGFVGVSAVSVVTSSSQDLSNKMDAQTEAINKNTEEVKKQTEETKKQTETIKDSDTSGSKDSANSFFSGFEDNDYGLSDIIKMPLTFIKGLASSNCSNLHLPLPLVDKTVELPCMTSIYSQYFGPFLTLYQTITTGIIAYWSCVNILKLVQGFKNPEKDEIEVMDL